MRVVTSAEMKALEAEADASGLTYAEMMRRAGEAVARAVDAELDGTGTVVILAGPGNNGGDALVAARVLHDNGLDVSAYLCQRDMDGDELVGELVRRDIDIVRNTEDPRRETLMDWLDVADAVVDGLLGTGLSRPLESDVAAILEAVAESARPADGPVVVAVDVPSGLYSDTGAVDPHTVPADITVTFGLPKLGFYHFPGAEFVGDLLHDSIGIPDDEPEGRLFVVTVAQVAAKLPQRPISAHKGTFGKVLAIAGSIPYTGAAALTGAAAYRAGCGLVTCAVPLTIHTAVSSRLPEATFLVLPEDMGVVSKGAAAVIHDAWSGYHAAVLGPGLTTERPAAEFLAALLAPLVAGDASGAGGGTAGAVHAPIGFRAGSGVVAAPGASDGGAQAVPSEPASGGDPTGDASESATRTTRPTLVVDADALNLLAASGGLALLPAGSIVTPHPGEMARLTGKTAADVNANRIGCARDVAASSGHVVVQKGPFTVIAAPDGRTAINPFANAALATAGTGDVLAGLIAGFLAQGLAPFDAALVGAFVHGMAGELCCRDIRGPILAREVLEMVPVVFQDLESGSA